MPQGSVRRRENALLLAASRCPDASPQAAPENAAYDWRYLLAAAEQQGVGALLRQSLIGAGAGQPPDWARAALDAAYWGQHFRNRFLLDELPALLARAVSAGLSVMPLKGAALVHGYYPAAALRPMSDLDLLIRPDDTERMADLLHDCGYLPVTRPASNTGSREYAFVAHRAEGAALVEYRSEPLDPMTGFPAGLDPALAARLRTHAARMWERGQAGEYAGAPMVRIAPEDLLLHVTSHLATRHAGFRLLWLHDVCRILAAHPTDFDWHYFCDEAAMLNLTVPVEAALIAAHRWLGAPLPRGGGGLSPLPYRLGDRRESLLPPTNYVERRITMRAVARLDRADMAAETPRAWSEAVTAFCRLTSARARGRVLLFLAVPSPDYLAWWMIEQGRPAASYRRMLVARWRQIGADTLRAARIRLTAIARRAVPSRRR